MIEWPNARWARNRAPAMPSATASGYAMAFESFSALTIASFVRENYTSIVLNGQQSANLKHYQLCYRRRHIPSLRNQFQQRLG